MNTKKECMACYLAELLKITLKQTEELKKKEVKKKLLTFEKHNLN